VRVKEGARELIEFALMACSPVATGVEGKNVMGGRNLAGLGFRPFRSALYLTSECSSSLSYPYPALSLILRLVLTGHVTKSAT